MKMEGDRLKPFTSYLFEYDKGRKVRNVGFVKVEPGEKNCIIHIHGKGLRMQDDKNLNIYLFYEEDGKCIGIWQGTIENVNPAINYRLTYTSEEDGMSQHYDQICGIILKTDRGRTYSAVWDDHMAKVEDMTPWVKFEYPRPERSDLPDEELDEAGLAEPKEEAGLEEESELEQETTPEQGASEEEIRPEQNEPDEVKAQQMEERQELDSHNDSCGWKKISRSDLAKLPRCEWKLANNSFLLHGYYNYKHLMFIREEQRCLLGVPGIYHPREARAAATFGFVEFVPMAKLDASWEEETDEENFGYWCRQVKEPIAR